MKKILVLGLITLVSAGVTGVISMKLQGTPPAVAEHAGADPAHADPASPAHSSNEHSTATSDPKNDGHGPAREELPVAVRSKPMTVEEILKYGAALKKREETINLREQDLSQQESQLRLVFADIQGEQREVDGLRAQIREQTALANQLLDQVRERHTQLEQTKVQVTEQSTQLQSKQLQTDDLHKDNIKRMSAWFQSMEPTKAAQFLKELVNDGNMPMAVQLLSNFEEREAAKVLSALDDPSLMVQLAESFKELKRPGKKEAAAP